MSGKGTGMGLASVVETLRTHNGALEVDSVCRKKEQPLQFIYSINHGIEEFVNEESVPRGVGNYFINRR